VERGNCPIIALRTVVETPMIKCFGSPSRPWSFKVTKI